MSISKYKVFKTVVDLGSLTKAAEVLNLTQSAVSYSIANLESELGFPLLIRKRSGIILTSNGQSILGYIRTILQWNEKLQQEAAAINGLEAGTIRIGAFTSVCIQWLPECIKLFKLNYPLIEIKVLQGTYQDVERWIAEGVIDFGFVTLPTFESFESIPLTKDKLLCILPENHTLGGEKQIYIKQLDKESFIANNDIKRLLKGTSVTLKSSYDIIDDRAIVAMVENGLGVSVMAELVLKGVQHKVRILELDPKQYRTIAIAALSVRELSPASQRFIENLRTWLKSNYNLIES
ncbi:LysR family transcriptional regulator [Bacillus sp. JRC01]|nr:LysR family transcriptional regulator [Bacillus sp. JRC01]